MIILNYILFLYYEKINYYVWFSQKKVLNDLETNISGVTLLTTNVEENPDVLIKENLDVLIRKNPDESVEENLDVWIEENLKQNFKRLIWVCCNYNLIPDGVSKYMLITLINKMKFDDVT